MSGAGGAGARPGQDGARWRDVDLGAARIVVRAETSKAKRADEIPIHPDLIEDLRRIRGDALPQARVFLSIPPIREFRDDLRAARIPEEDANGRRLDFHALRGTFGTMLARSGVTPQIAHRLMRHASMETTMKHYTFLGLQDMAGAIAKVPAAGSKERQISACAGTR